MRDLAFVPVPPLVAAVAHLVAAEVATRRLRASDAERALSVAEDAARQCGVTALRTDVAQARQRLDGVAARLVGAEGTTPLRIADLEGLLASDRLIVDACRRRLRRGGREVSLVQRPVQFELLLALAILRAPHPEVRELAVKGVIRPEDVSSTNDVAWDRVAEARIVYGGRGVLSDVQQPRYGQQLFDILFPF